jgi:hypothetical protein
MVLFKVALQLSTKPSSNSDRTPVKTKLVKQSQSGSLQVLSREQNGAINTAAKDSNSNPVSPVLGRSCSMAVLCIRCKVHLLTEKQVQVFLDVAE